jgi:Uma2 family endonuclease
MTTIDKLAIILPANQVYGPRQGGWTYADYAALPNDGQRYEVMDGVLLMAPSPNAAHQSVITRLAVFFFQYVESAGIGRIFVAPFDVELATNRVVQPDALVLLNRSLGKLTASHVVGAPDLVVEVASPGTAVYDRLNKFEAYARAGVEEYWLVDPEVRSIEVLVLQNGTYYSKGIFRGENTIFSQVVPAIAIVKVERFFA